MAHLLAAQYSIRPNLVLLLSSHLLIYTRKVGKLLQGSPSLVKGAGMRSQSVTVRRFKSCLLHQNGHSKAIFDKSDSSLNDALIIVCERLMTGNYGTLNHPG